MIPSRIVVLLFIIVLLAGCAGATPSAAPSELPPAATSTLPPRASATPRPSATPLPSQTPLPSATATITLTATTTPDPALADARLLGVSWQASYNLLLSIQFPGPVDAANYKVMVEDKQYECQVLADQPSRLFCIGQGMNVYDRVTVRIFPAGSEQPGFEGQISIPYFTN